MTKNQAPALELIPANGAVSGDRMLAVTPGLLVHDHAEVVAASGATPGNILGHDAGLISPNAALMQGQLKSLKGKFKSEKTKTYLSMDTGREQKARKPMRH